LRAERKREKEREIGPAGIEGREKRERGFSLFFKLFSNSFFKLSNFNQTRKPCIRIMMHNHLLFLIYLSDI
jgi:hypothetical protein